MVINVKKIFGIAILSAFLSACSDDITAPNTLSETGEKTPLSVTALLDAGGSSTRAADKKFEEGTDATGDQLLAYIRHVKWNGPVDAGETQNERTQQHTSGFNKLVTFTAKDNILYTGSDIKPIGLGGEIVVATKTGAVTNQAATLTASPALYWDDFSANDANDGQENSLNLRDEGHYLQSYYGYCYNGSPAYGETGTHITSALEEATGILGWSVVEDQTAADKSAFKTSDLLWSAEQTPIKYAHVDGEGKKNHGTLILPYTHAMSKVTINVSLHESFGDGAVFKGVETKLHEMFSTCTCTAPTYTLTAKGTSEGEGKTTDITMWNKESANEGKIKTCTFEAIVVPSVLSVVNNFATIEGLDGNKYVIPITDKMLQKTTDTKGNKIGWGWELTETAENISNGTAQSHKRTRADGTIYLGKGYEMKSGVNYVLNVNISKQEITVSALIKDWTNVEAEGKALVQFNSDVNGKGDIADALKTTGFDVYKTKDNNAFDTKTTTLTWDNTNSKWEYTPVVYWAGQGDASYFRALSPKGQGTSMSQGTDMLWGYACDDDANNGNKVGTNAEVAITPRTGDVPLHFEHPMSKISVELKTSDDNAKRVDLTGAKLSIINLYDKGTLSMTNGTIGSLDYSKSDEPYTFKDQTFDANNKWSNKIVIPQSLIKDKEGNDRTQVPTFSDTGELTDKGNKIVMYLTLADGTRYRLDLSNCVVNETGVPVTEWQRGKHYTYTISVEKEQITFRALIKDWEENQGSGNANLEWD